MGQRIRLPCTHGRGFAARKAEPTGEPLGATIVIQERHRVKDRARKFNDAYAADSDLTLGCAQYGRLYPAIENGHTMLEIQERFCYEKATGTDDALRESAPLW